MSLNSDDIVAFIKDKWPNQRCPKCGHDEWATGEDHNFKAVIPVGDNAASSVMQTVHNLPAVWLVCTNCGHVELVSAKVVRQWKEARPK